MLRQLATCWYCGKKGRKYRYVHFPEDEILFKGTAKIVCENCFGKGETELSIKLIKDQN